MGRIRSAFIILVPLALSLGAAPAQAQLARTFVSAAVGSDANDCNRLTPCRTFQTAHDKTNSMGEITVLDPGGYGAVTITKSISIVNDGVGEAGILVSGGGTGITVNGGFVNLRGLTIKGIGFGGGIGIAFNNTWLTVENCAIRGLDGPGHGLVAATPLRLAVSNTVISDNSGIGIRIRAQSRPGGQPLAVALDHVTMHNNATGLHVENIDGARTDVVVTDSSATSNTNGIWGQDDGAGGVTVMLVRSVVANNVTGVTAFNPGTTVFVGQSTIVGNTSVAWGNMGSGGVIQSFGDNQVNGNGGGEGAMPLIATK